MCVYTYIYTVGCRVTIDVPVQSFREWQWTLSTALLRCRHAAATLPYAAVGSLQRDRAKGCHTLHLQAPLAHRQRRHRRVVAVPAAVFWCSYFPSRMA